MIPWRYHLVSIMAIFLALGLGVVVGTTVINPGLVKNLNNQTDELTQHVRDLQKEKLDLESELDTLGAFGEQALPYLVADALFGRQVVIVTEEGVDPRAMAETRRALDLSDAEILTMLTVRPSMSGETPAAHRELATLLGLSSTTSSDLLASEAARSLARRLATDPVGDLSGQPDPLGEMLSQGFLTSSAPDISDSALKDIGGRGQMVVAIGGGTDDELSPTSALFMEPFLIELISSGVVSGAGESLASDEGFVTELRSSVDDSSVAPLVTVDNVDLPVGASAMVLALQEALSNGSGGDYGVKDGTTRLLPPVG
ncbi:MAG: copper transporter [Actinomycetota bacterium]